MSALIAGSNAATRSLQVSGLYPCITGAGLLLAPALLLAPLGLSLPHDVWIRMFGILALGLGACDVLAARSAVATLIPGSVWRRLLAGAGIGLLVPLGRAPTAMLLFAAVGIAAALWTAMVSRRLPAGTLFLT